MKNSNQSITPLHPSSPFHGGTRGGRQSITPLHPSSPLHGGTRGGRQPIPRTWFLYHGYEKADTRYTNGRAIWLHPHTNDVYSSYGIIKLNVVPKKKHKPTGVQYLVLPNGYGCQLLSRLKYLTFKGEIKKGETIDHIDGNTFNNDIRNLRAIKDSINRRDGGFLKKLRNHGIDVAQFHYEFIIEGYERMARWKNSHNTYRYNQLDKNELLRIFTGPTFSVIDPDIIMDLDFERHREC